MVGVLSRDEALAKAEEEGLDLVEIQPQADPPVCKIMDFGKFKFEQQKKANEAKKKTKQVEIKELKFRPVTDEGDYQIKLRNMRRFLEEGDKVKVNIRFRGREMSHQELGREMAARIEADLGDDIVIESRPRLEGRQMVMMIAPKKEGLRIRFGTATGPTGLLQCKLHDLQQFPATGRLRGPVLPGRRASGTRTCPDRVRSRTYKQARARMESVVARLPPVSVTKHHQGHCNAQDQDQPGGGQAFPQNRLRQVQVRPRKP